MAEVTKDVAYPKKVWPPGFAAPVDLAPYIPGLERRQKEFLAAGIPVPLVWKHDETATPGKETLLKLSQGDARLALGEVSDCRICPEGILHNTFTVPIQEDRDRLTAVPYCSPWIKWNWRDGNGKVWEGPSILHVAVTARPVQTPQRSFQLSHDGHPEELSIALADYEEKEAMPDTPEETPKETPKKESKKEIKPGDGFDKDIIDCLSGYGINLPPDTDEKNIWERIRIVCHAKSEGDKGGGGAMEKPTEVTQPSPVGLSHDNKASAVLLKRAKKDIIADIELAFKEGRCDGEDKETATKELDSLQLSFTDDGDLVQNAVLTKIAVWKKNPTGTFWSPALRLAHDNDQPTAIADPEASRGDQSKLNPAVMARMTGGRWKPPSN